MGPGILRRDRRSRTSTACGADLPHAAWQVDYQEPQFQSACPDHRSLSFLLLSVASVSNKATR
jgi:hypothetical protein